MLVTITLIFIAFVNVLPASMFVCVFHISTVVFVTVSVLVLLIYDFRNTSTLNIDAVFVTVSVFFTLTFICIVVFVIDSVLFTARVFVSANVFNTAAVIINVIVCVIASESVTSVTITTTLNGCACSFQNV